MASHTYGSIAEFRAAVDELLSPSLRLKKSRSNKKVANNPRQPRSLERRGPSRKARKNMAFPKVVDGIPFDSMEELIAYKQGVAAAPAAPAYRTQRAAPLVPGQTARAGKKKGKVYRDPYAKIAASVGGSRVLCPHVNWDVVRPQAKEAGLGAYAMILQGMGLTPVKAAAVVSAMEAANVLTHGSGARFRKSPEQQAQARQILAQAGVTCPLPTRNNSGRRRYR